MTRKRAWMIAAAATITVILFVLATGASFGQFGLGGDRGTRAQASGIGQQSEPRALYEGDDQDREESDEDDDDEGDEDEDGEHDDGDREDGGEHEDEDD